MDIIKGNILVFKDQRVELLPGEAENLEPLAPGPCTLTVENQPPPEPPEDPRWAILREANPYTLDYARKVVNRFDRANSAFPVSDLATIAIDVINQMPQEIKNKYCGHWTAGSHVTVLALPARVQGRGRATHELLAEQGPLLLQQSSATNVDA